MLSSKSFKSKLSKVILFIQLFLLVVKLLTANTFSDKIDISILSEKVLAHIK